jgi:hypothetical protein
MGLSNITTKLPVARPHAQKTKQSADEHFKPTDLVISIPYLERVLSETLRADSCRRSANPFSRNCAF